MVTRIKTDDETFIARKKNETFLVDAETSLAFLNSTVGINATGASGGRTIRIDGDLATAQGTAVAIACSEKNVERVIVGPTAHVTGSFNGINASGGLVEVRVFGEVAGGFSAIDLSSTTATLRNSGTIEGGTSAAVRSLSGDLTLKNSGQIVAADGFTVRASGDSCTIVNSGSIERAGSGTAIVVSHGTFDLTNTGNVIADEGTAIFLGGGISGVGKATIVNEGTIFGLVDAIFAQSVPSNDVYTIVNTGEIIGNIDLSASERNDLVNTSNGRVEGDIVTGAGSDRIVLVNAIVTGAVVGGLGDDVYTISSDDINFQEEVDQGTDTVRATGNFSVTLGANFENLVLIGKNDTQATGNSADNVITGNAGNNVIDGAAGEDTIRGGTGRDEMVGGADVDTFIFRKGDGKDLIGDFDTGGGHDFLDLSGIKGITDFDDLIDNHARDVDGDVVINAGKGDQVVLEGLTVAELRAELFFL